MEQTNTRKSKWIAAGKIILGICLLALVLWKFKWRDAVTVFAGMNWVWFGIAAALGAVGIMISSWKLWALVEAKGIRIPFFKVWGLYYIGTFFNSFLPTNVGGDVVKVWGLARYSGNTMDALSATLMERATWFAVLAAGGLIMLAAGFPVVDQLQVGIMRIPALVSLILIVLSPALYALFKSPLDRASRGIKGGRLVDRIRGFGRSVTDYFTAPSALILSMILSVVFYFARVVLLLVLCLSVGIRVGFVPLILIVSLATIVSLLPFTINALGIREGALTILLSRIGPSHAQALAVALLYTAALVLNSAIGGIIYLFQDIKRIEINE